MNITVNELVLKAKEGREKAYAPYSKFKVGAALYMKNGHYITGCNIENASYGLCNCAERTAMFQAVALGYKKEDILAMAIIGDTESPISPCGACRQVMAELLPSNCKIYLANMKGSVKETSIEELLPYSFSDSDL